MICKKMITLCLLCNISNILLSMPRNSKMPISNRQSERIKQVKFRDNLLQAIRKQVEEARSKQLRDRQ